jgi:hypothetical protein
MEPSGSEPHSENGLTRTWRELWRDVGAEDYLRIADDSYSIRPNHLKILVFIGDLQG